VKQQEKPTGGHGAGPELSEEQRQTVIIYGNYSHCLARAFSVLISAILENLLHLGNKRPICSRYITCIVTKKPVFFFKKIRRGTNEKGVLIDVSA
jgi:hypothetical protein